MAEKAMHTPHNFMNMLVIITLVILIVAYFLPWTWHKDAALSPGAYDLAEWTTLHPASHNTTPPLNASLYLRLCLGLASALWINHRDRFAKRLRWIPIGIALWAVFYLLPPPDFFMGAGNDANYRQQFITSIVTAILAIGCWFLPRLGKQALHIVTLLLCGAAILAAIAGLNGGMKLMTTFNVGHVIGIGPILFIAGIIMLSITILWSWTQKIRE